MNIIRTTAAAVAGLALATGLAVSSAPSAAADPPREVTCSRDGKRIPCEAWADEFDRANQAEFDRALTSVTTAYGWYRDRKGLTVEAALKKVTDRIEPSTAADRRYLADLQMQIDAAWQQQADAARRKLNGTDSTVITGGTAAERKIAKDVMAKVGGNLPPGVRVDFVANTGGGWGSAQVKTQKVSGAPKTAVCGDVITCTDTQTASWPQIWVRKGMGKKTEVIVAHEAQHLRQFAFYGGMTEAFAATKGSHKTPAGVHAIEFEADLMLQLFYGPERARKSWYIGVFAPKWTPTQIAQAKKVLDGTGGWTAPAITGVAKPTVTGTAKAGKTLTAKPDRKVSVTQPKITYQWLRNGKPIAGATKATYKPTKADRGRKVAVQVTYAKPWYATKAVTSTAKTIR